MIFSAYHKGIDWFDPHSPVTNEWSLRFFGQHYLEYVRHQSVAKVPPRHGFTSGISMIVTLRSAFCDM
jgi:hypothetical protein